MEISRVIRIAYFLTFPLVAIASVPPVHLGQVATLTASREIENEIEIENEREIENENEIENGRMAAETRLRRAVFDLIPATGDRRREREKGRLCREGRTRKSLNLGNRGGTFANYRKFIGRHSKGQRRSRRKLKKLFMDWLKEEREKVMKEGDEMH